VSAYISPRNKGVFQNNAKNCGNSYAFEEGLLEFVDAGSIFKRKTVTRPMINPFFPLMAGAAALASSAMSGGVSVIASPISLSLSTPLIFLLFRQITATRSKQYNTCK
jgi:hypothetical protein